MDGTEITSRSHHREHMRKHNVIECGDVPVDTTRREQATPVGEIARDIVDSIKKLGGH
jgi:hypothetical protein